MKFGICCAPNALGEPKRLLEVLENAGADYVEWAVGGVMASDEAFEGLQEAVKNSKLAPEAFMSFLPPHHRITGPNVNLNEALDYATQAMQRCAILGGERVVLGSAGARKVPDGFSKDEARTQFVDFCRELAPRAQKAGIVVVIEPLNVTEDNLINTVAQGASVVDEVNHPNIQLLADFFHMFHDDEPISNIVAANGKIQHTHCADLGRVAPSFASQGEADFVGFFGALKQIGYDQRCSFEGKTEDFAAQAKPLLAHLKRRWEEAGR